MKKILYIDLDNVLVDFPTGIEKLDPATKEKFEGKYDDVPGIFSLMEPVKEAISSFNLLPIFRKCIVEKSVQNLIIKYLHRPSLLTNLVSETIYNGQN